MTACTTMTCPIPGTVTGTFRMDDEPDRRVTYCQPCAKYLWTDGVFEPDDLSLLHAAPELSDAEKAVIAEFDAAPAAPESYDAVAAVRRVMRLVEHLEEPVFRPSIYLGEFDRGKRAGEDSERLVIAQRLRAAVEGVHA